MIYPGWYQHFRKALRLVQLRFHLAQLTALDDWQPLYGVDRQLHPLQ
jgi:hypothetical protein